jgi:hypothetical protein
MKRWNERNPVVDSEGWVQWNGGKMPVEKGTLIDVKYRNKSENIGVIAGIKGCKTGSNKGMYAFDWRYTGRSGDIIAYRLHAPRVQKTPQQLALEKFGADWHDNEGVQPLSDTSIKIDLEFKNGIIRENVDVQSSSFKIPFDTEVFTVTKWRIHSDEKESQADHEVKPIAFDDGPMVSEPVRKSPLSTQIGGDHYTKLAIQPMQYSMKNGLDPLQHTIIKYVTSFRDKAGIEDLEKAKHCIDMLIELAREGEEGSSKGVGEMTMKSGDKSAMPNQALGPDGLPNHEPEFGLTKREMMAMAAMQGLCAHSGDYHTFANMASDAVNYADALLAELERTK